MRAEDIRSLPSMPLAGPSYPAGPYRFVDREYMIISYETDPEIVREQLPEPLEPLDTPIVHYEWIAMPDSPASAAIPNPVSSSPAALTAKT